MSLLSQPGKPVWNYLVLMYKQGGKEEETGKRSRRSKQASCSHPSFKGDFYLMCLFSQSTVRLHKRFGEKSAQEDGVPWFKKVQISFFQCRLRLLKEERIKDYLLMEEEFISNQVDYYTQICPECCSDASMWSKPLKLVWSWSAAPVCWSKTEGMSRNGWNPRRRKMKRSEPRSVLLTCYFVETAVFNKLRLIILA